MQIAALKARDAILRRLGFSSYAEYLESDFWKQIREQAFIRHGRMCRLCDEPATLIHHLGYGKSTLYGRSLKALVPLCQKCHCKIHTWPEGKMRSLDEARTAYHRLWAKKKAKNKGLAPEDRKGLYGYCLDCGGRTWRNTVYCRRCLKPVPKLLSKDQRQVKLLVQSLYRKFGTLP